MRRTIGLLISCLLVTIPGARGDSQPREHGKRVSGSAFDGVIFPAPAASHPGPRAPERWTPSPVEILDLEKQLASYVSAQMSHRKLSLSKNLSDYKRQYAGIVENERREIDVQLFHQSTEVVKSGWWLRGPVGVAGVGEDYLRARYDADNRKFLWFSIREQD